MDNTESLEIPYPSAHQADILDWVREGRGHGLVQAVAGSGKTALISHAATLLKTPSLYLAFNKSMAKRMSANFKSLPVTVKTIHALGMKALRDHSGTKVDIDNRKMEKILRIYLREFVEQGHLGLASASLEDLAALRSMKADEDWAVLEHMVSLVDKARVEKLDLSSEADFRGLMARYDIELPACLLPYAAEIGAVAIARGIERYQVGRVIDFTDMVWLPAVLAIHPPRYGFVFVDEAQDLSASQLELVYLSVAPGGRILFVGDPNQSVYGFAGASPAVMQTILEDTGATVMPLTVSYRSPKAIAAAAKKHVSGFEARADAPEGILTSKHLFDVLLEIKDGDLVLCRVNEPLVSLCLELIRSGISAAVLGQDVLDKLIRILHLISGAPDFSFEDFPKHLQRWREMQLAFVDAENLGEERGRARTRIVNDQANCLASLWQEAAAPNLERMVSTMKDLFAVDRPAVTLATIHRAKGLEADRVYLLRPDLLPYPEATSDRDLMQENNLEYVAYTRARMELVLVHEDPEGP